MYSVAVKCLIEVIGTFFFVSVILNMYKNKLIGPIAIAVALLLAIYLGGPISGGHFNPAVTLSMYLKHKLAFNEASMYVLSQIIGAYVAILVNK